MKFEVKARIACGPCGSCVCFVMFALGKKRSCSSTNTKVSMCVEPKCLTCPCFQDLPLEVIESGGLQGPGDSSSPSLIQGCCGLVYPDAGSSKAERVFPTHCKQPRTSPHTEQSFYQHPRVQKQDLWTHEHHRWLSPVPLFWLIRYTVCWWTHTQTLYSFLHR